MKRLRALAVLLCHGLTVAAPVLDAALFHHDPLEARSHIEAADTRCHSESCDLGAPQQSVTPAAPATDTLREAPLFRAVTLPVEATPPADRRPERPLGPRGPPVLT